MRNLIALPPGRSASRRLFAVLGVRSSPTMRLTSKIGGGKELIIKALPDALDLLTVCVEAGLGFDQAMQKVGRSGTMNCPRLRAV